jgi:hypothetical protein
MLPRAGTKLGRIRLTSNIIPDINTPAAAPKNKLLDKDTINVAYAPTHMSQNQRESFT